VQAGRSAVKLAVAAIAMRTSAHELDGCSLVIDLLLHANARQAGLHVEQQLQQLCGTMGLLSADCKSQSTRTIRRQHQHLVILC
jgi:hypothetical protein